MAGDWIKWEKGLTHKPEVLRTAAALGIHRRHAAGLWMEFWEWAEAQTMTGSIRGITPAMIDEIVQQPGFAIIGQDIGWLLLDDAGLIVPNFDRHNNECARRRAMAAERKRIYRARQSREDVP